MDPSKKVPDLNCAVQDLLLEVVDLKQEVRYDTIRDTILTCARKPTYVSLIYRTELNLPHVCVNGPGKQAAVVCSNTVRCLITVQLQYYQSIAMGDYKCG